MLAIWSLVPLPFLKPAWTSGSSWFTYCWSLTWRIFSITLLECERRPGVLWFTGSQRVAHDWATSHTDVFLELSCFFHDPADVGNLIFCSSAFSKTSLNIREFTVHVLLKPGLENFKHYFTSMWDEWNCAVVWAFFGIAFLWDWNENWPFPVLWPLLSCPNLSAAPLQHHLLGFEIA